MVKYEFICEKCGNIQKGKFDQRTTELVCNVCGNAMGWGNSFPPLNALDFISMYFKGWVLEWRQNGIR